MTETILETRTLPEILLQRIRAEKVKMREINGEIRCPLRGMFADGKISSYKFMEKKQFEKELER
ncbi:MAG: hypothetical protein FWC70_06835 [Defluviitaleaceae bacterium]|nr:hypothetical protein [Defluviitaleaceae bacterium]